jgi:hypothetical protein
MPHPGLREGSPRPSASGPHALTAFLEITFGPQVVVAEEFAIPLPQRVGG